MKILITGAAGFIGAACAGALLDRGHDVCGIDNFNDYYDPRLKVARVNNNEIHVSKEGIASISYDRAFTPDIVLHLAAQAGVTYSINNPQSYVDNNITGTFNVLEYCRSTGCRLVYASSSSVYGDAPGPSRETDDANAPMSFYAATKKACEVMAYSYSHLYGIQTCGLRFFTVYGPWGRPDMAAYKLTDAALYNRPVTLYNHGNNVRDFTYIDDVVSAVVKIIEGGQDENYKLYNIGGGNPVSMEYLLSCIEKHTGRRANVVLKGPQPGDVTRTHADISAIKADYGWGPVTDIREGLEKYVEWHIDYYEKN